MVSLNLDKKQKEMKDWRGKQTNFSFNKALAHFGQMCYIKDIKGATAHSMAPWGYKVG